MFQDFKATEQCRFSVTCLGTGRNWEGRRELKTVLWKAKMDYMELEQALKAEASEIAREDRQWKAADVSRRLSQIADELARIRREHPAGIDASMGKRSGWKVEI